MLKNIIGAWFGFYFNKHHFIAVFKGYIDSRNDIVFFVFNAGIRVCFGKNKADVQTDSKLGGLAVCVTSMLLLLSIIYYFSGIFGTWYHSGGGKNFI